MFYKNMFSIYMENVLLQYITIFTVILNTYNWSILGSLGIGFRGDLLGPKFSEFSLNDSLTGLQTYRMDKEKALYLLYLI